MPFTRLNAGRKKELVTPPTYCQLNATLNERMKALPREWTSEIANEFRYFTIGVQREASARSAACGQQFARTCQNCSAVAPTHRAACVCGCIVCCSCADSAANCPACASTTYIRLFEEASRECLICLEMPFSRTAFVSCGHIVCTACAARMTVDLTTEGICCPFCRAPVENIVNLEEIVVCPSFDVLSNLAL